MPDENKRENTRWSYSRASCFDNCKYEYYLQYIVRDPDTYLSEGNFYAEIGGYCHEILAMIFRGELKKEDAARYFEDNYGFHVFYQASQSAMENAYSSCLSYFNNIDLSWLKPYDVVGVELEKEFCYKNLSFIGIIDLLLRDKKDGKFVIMDHKSSSYPFKKDGGLKKHSESAFETYKRQMYLYCYAVKTDYGDFPKKIIWNHFKDGGKLAEIPFDESEYRRSLDWYVKVIADANKEEDYEPSQDFFYCKNLCNFRNSCEYAKGW